MGEGEHRTLRPHRLRTSGLALVSNIEREQATQGTPVIFLTAKDTPKDVIAGIKAGARLYPTKPFRPDELLERVRQVLPAVPDSRSSAQLA